jgi:hypothetical protein
VNVQTVFSREGVWSSEIPKIRMNCLLSIPKPVWALAASIVLGAVFTFLWAEFSYYLRRRKFPVTEADPEAERGRWTSAIMGILQRAFLTTIVIWLPMSTGPIAATLIVVNVAVGWGRYDTKSLEGRSRYTVSLMNGIVSVFWAIAWGIWANSN